MVTRKAAAMRRSMVAAALIGALAAASGALAQDTLQWAKFVDLIERKGIKDAPEGDACAAFGLPKTCTLTLAPYRDREGYAHVFSIFRDPDTKALHIIMFKDWQSIYGRRLRQGNYYLTGLDGKLRGAAVASPEKDGKRTWTPLAADSPDAQKGFAEEIAFWRARQQSLENEPDRPEG
jgi:hypothetical protein